MLMTYFRSLLAQLVSEEKGQTAIEYALVVALISVVVIAAVVTLFTGTGGVLDSVKTAITGAF